MVYPWDVECLSVMFLFNFIVLFSGTKETNYFDLKPSAIPSGQVSQKFSSIFHQQRAITKMSTKAVCFMEQVAPSKKGVSNHFSIVEFYQAFFLVYSVFGSDKGIPHSLKFQVKDTFFIPNYSQGPNKCTGPNNSTGWKFLEN